MKLEQLVYVSRATAPPVTQEGLAEIVAQSRRHNPRNNITGALAATPTGFLQLLEGSPGSLDVLILKLMLDPRHHDLVFVDRAAIAERSFNVWAMVAPDFSASGQRRLDALLAQDGPTMRDFEILLLEMVAGEPLA